MCKGGDESSLNIRSAIVTAQCIVMGSQCHGHMLGQST